jgi:hypothetical protein
MCAANLLLPRGLERELIGKRPEIGWPNPALGGIEESEAESEAADGELNLGPITNVLFWRSWFNTESLVVPSRDRIKGLLRCTQSP